jgi:FADH2 O2-dependent halogenase
MTTRSADVAIVGSGFSGAILAMILRRLGRTVVLLERGAHPRFAIGESSTPLASLLMEELAERYDLPVLRAFTKYGTWKRERPDVACGLKRGFSFFRHHAGRPFGGARADSQLLVAASPNDEIGDVHWYRPDFDHFLVREAQAMGVEYLDHTSLDRFEPPSAPATNATLLGTREGQPIEVAARLVVDASGPRGFLHRACTLPERALPMPGTQALFAHFTGVARFGDVVPDAFGDTPPYPVDAAAVHHVIDGGWIWVLRFDNGITSAGLAATDALADDLRLTDGAAAWDRMLARYPAVAAQFADACPVTAFAWQRRIAFASERASGDGWVMLPSAVGVVDPLLSTGFPLTLLGIGRVADAIARHWDSDDVRAALAAYAERTTRELDVTARLVSALYAAFDDWEKFSALTQLYFAAASYTESARRLGNAVAAGDGFLLSGVPGFADGFDRALTLASAGSAARAECLRTISATIAPFNVAGLDDPSKRGWYACEAGDLLDGAGKLSASRADVQAMLERCGFARGGAPAR